MHHQRSSSPRVGTRGSNKASTSAARSHMSNRSIDSGVRSSLIAAKERGRSSPRSGSLVGDSLRHVRERGGSGRSSTPPLSDNVNLGLIGKKDRAIQQLVAEESPALNFLARRGSEAEKSTDEEEENDEASKEEAMANAERKLADDAEWKKIQRNTFTRWANEHLKQKDGMRIEDLETDLSDGLKLIALIEVLSGKWMPRHNKKPNFRSQKLENVSIALEFLDREGVTLVNIDSTDIVDKKLKLILGLIYTLILHYAISMPMWDGPPLGGKVTSNGKTPKQMLMQWIKDKLPAGCPVSNFTSDWNDGKAVSALVNSVAPGLCPNWEDCDPNTPIKNATEAMDLADRWLNVPKVLTPEEIANPNVDEQSVMTYLSQFPNAKLKPGAPLRQRADASKVRAYGPGLEPVGVVVAKAPANFTVETIGAGDGELTIQVIGPYPDVECEWRYNHDRKMTYSCSYVPQEEGEYKVIIVFSRKNIPGSPYPITVEGFAGDAKKVTASGPGLESEGVIINRSTYFDIFAEGAGRGKPEVIVLDPKGKKDSAVIDLQGLSDNQDTYRCEYMATLLGLHSVNIFFAGNPIPDSPYGVNVSPASLPGRVWAHGRGLQPHGIRVREAVSFKVHTEGAGEGEIGVKIIGPGGIDLPVSGKIANDEGSVTEYTYKPLKEGRHIIMITFAGQEISRSPFEVNIGPYKSSRIKAYGPGLKGGMVNKAALFTVDTCGETGTLGFSIEGPSQARINCKDNGDGSADVDYVPTAEGEYAVHILCDKEDIPGSPYMAQILPSTADYHPDKVKAYGPGLENGINPKEKTYFTVDTREAGTAPLELIVADGLGERVPETVEKSKGVFECSYTPGPGQHKQAVLVNFGNVAVPGSPFHVLNDNPNDPSLVEVYGPGVEDGVTAGRPVEFTVDCVGSGPGDVKVSITSSKKKTAPVSVFDNKDDTYNVTYETADVGPHKIAISLDGIEVPQSPIAIEVKAAVDLNKIRLVDFEPEAFVDCLNDFYVDTSQISPIHSDENGRKLSQVECEITGPDGSHVEACIEKIGPNGPFQVSYTPTEIGDHEIDLRYDGTPLPDSPFPVTARRGCNPGKVTAFGDGLEKAIVDETNLFTIETKNSGTGRLGLAMEGPSEATVECVDNQDGSCTVEYVPTEVGEYDITIKYSDQHIPGSPFKVHCATRNGKPKANPDRVEAYGPGLDPGSVLPGKPTQFTIDASKTAPAPIQVSIESDGKPISPRRPVIRDQGDCLHEVSYVPPPVGEPYEVSVKYDGKDILGSPFVMTSSPLMNDDVIVENVDTFRKGTRASVSSPERGYQGNEVGLRQRNGIEVESGSSSRKTSTTSDSSNQYEATNATTSRKDKRKKSGSILRGAQSVGDEDNVFDPDVINSDYVKGLNNLGDNHSRYKRDKSDGSSSRKQSGKGSFGEADGEHDGVGGSSRWDSNPDDRLDYRGGKRSSSSSVTTPSLDGLSSRKGSNLSNFDDIQDSSRNGSRSSTNNSSSGLAGLRKESGLSRYGSKERPSRSSNGSRLGSAQKSPLDRKGSVEKEGSFSRKGSNTLSGGRDLTGRKGSDSSNPVMSIYDQDDEGVGPYSGSTRSDMGRVTREDDGLVTLSSRKGSNQHNSRKISEETDSVGDASGSLRKGSGLSRHGGDASTYGKGTSDIHHTLESQTGSEPHHETQLLQGGKNNYSATDTGYPGTGYAGDSGTTSRRNSHLRGSRQNSLEGGHDGAKGTGKYDSGYEQSGNYDDGLVDSRNESRKVSDKSRVWPQTLGDNESHPYSKVGANRDGHTDRLGGSSDTSPYQFSRKSSGLQSPRRRGGPSDVNDWDDNESGIGNGPKNSMGHRYDDSDSRVGSGGVGPGQSHGNGRYVDDQACHRREDGGSRRGSHILGGDDNRNQLAPNLGGNETPSYGSEVKKGALEFIPLELNNIPLPHTNGVVTADIQTPRSHIDHPHIINDGKGSVGILYQPHEEGLHTLDIKQEGNHVQGSPYSFYASKTNVDGKVHAYGEGLTHGTCGDPANFVISTKGTSEGGLSLAVEGPSKAEINCQNNKDGTINVSYLPTAPGEYQIYAKFADEHIDGSPFNCKVTGKGIKRNAISVGSSSDLTLPHNLSDYDLRALNAYIISPSGVEEPCFLKKLPRGNSGISFTPREVGDHLVSVKRNGKHIKNSPFKVTVNPEDVGDASRVVVDGSRLIEGRTQTDNTFQVDTKKAGYGGLSLSVEGPSKAEIRCKDNEDGTLDVSYKPTEPGLYIVKLKFADEHVPGSPFAVAVSGEGSEKLTENIARMREAVPITEVGSQCRMTFKLPGISCSDLRASVQAPTGQVESAVVTKLEEGLFDVNFVPYELGVHTVMVKYRDVDIPGSPFQFTVGPLQDGGAHRVHAGGPGLERGVQGQSAEFNVWTREAGHGSLAISVEGPSKAEVDFNDQKDGSCHVSYVVDEPGEYSVGIRFNEVHIPGSPFKVCILPSAEEAERVRVSCFSDGPISPDVPQTMLLNMNGASGDVECKLVAPSGREKDCPITPLGDGEHSIRFIPHEEGVHHLHAKLNGIHIPGSPFKMVVSNVNNNVGVDDLSSTVCVRGKGVEQGVTGKDSVFTIDTSYVGAGTLSVTVDGPSKVDLSCNDVDDGYQVVYRPLVAGKYFVTVKHNGRNVTGSPFSVRVSGENLSSSSDMVQQQRTTHMAKRSSVSMETMQRTSYVRHQYSAAESSSSSRRIHNQSITGHRYHLPNFQSCDPSAVSCTGVGLETAVVNHRYNSFSVDCCKAGNSFLSVGIYGPEIPCEEVTLKHKGSQRYSVDYVVGQPGDYFIFVKWGDDHVPGSPFHVEAS